MKLFDFEDWDLTQLRDVLSYNSKTGEFHWLVKPTSRVTIGQRAGSVSVRGYRYIKIAGKSYQEHRLAWLYVYGDFPKGNLDHINRDPACNKIGNLRKATKSQNAGNATARKDKLKGAYWSKKSERWCSSICNEWLGFFKTEKEAHAAYCNAGKEKFGEFFYSG